MTLLGVTYHYVRPGSPLVPGLRYLDLEDFRKQLDWLSETRRNVSRDEFVSIMAGESPVSDGFFLTFDDGLSDHYQFVYPELTERGMWGSFYVPVGPYLDGRSLDVHLIHALLGVFGGAQVLSMLLQVLSELGIEFDEISKSNRYANVDDDEAIVEVKRKLNYELKVEQRSIVLDNICTRLDYQLDVADWYMTIPQMNEMVSAGMIIGSHSVSHRPMSQLSAEQQSHEIETSFQWLEANVPTREPRSFGYPYGGFDTFTPETESLLSGAGVKWSLNFENREISQSDVVNRPQALPRVDCCTLPHGKSRKHGA